MRSELQKLIPTNVLKNTRSSNPQAIATIKAVMRKADQKPAPGPRDRSKPGHEQAGSSNRSWKKKD